MVVLCGMSGTVAADESAIRRIEALGGSVTVYPVEGGEGGFAEVRLGEWRGTSSDIEMLKHIPKLSHLAIVARPLSDDDIKALVRLETVTHLWLDGTQIGDSAIKRLRSMESLTWLSLSDTLITDDGVKELRGLKNLVSLNLSRTRVRGRTLAHVPMSLASLFLSGNTLEELRLSDGDAREALERLNLENTHIGDNLLAHLEQCPNLTNLDLSRCHLTNAGLRHLSKLTKLGMLRLDWNDITDEGLVHLKNLHELSILTLQGAGQVTDAGLLHLRGMRNLEGVLLANTGVTPEAAQELERFLRRRLEGVQAEDMGSGKAPGEDLGSKKAPIKTGGE